jgi:hypothetical protein
LIHGHFVYLRPVSKFYGHLVHFLVTGYIFPRFGMLYQEKSGNPASRYFDFEENSISNSFFPMQIGINRSIS